MGFHMIAPGSPLEALEDLEPSKQLLILRDITRRTGLLNDVQQTHLRRWPALLFQGFKTTGKVNIPEKSVLFEVRRDAARATYKKEAVEALALWTKFLLGEDWVVRVEFIATKGRGKKFKFAARAVRNPYEVFLEGLEAEARRKNTDTTGGSSNTPVKRKAR